MDEDALHGLPLPGLPQQRLHAHLPPRPAPQAARVLQGRLRHVRRDAAERHDGADEEVGSGAGGHQGHEGVRREVRPRQFEDGQAGQVEGEAVEQKAPVGPHGEARRGGEPQVQVPGPGPARAARAPGERPRVRLPGRAGAVPERGVRPGPGQSRRARRTQRRGEDDVRQAHDGRAPADVGRGPAALAPAHGQVHAALRGRARLKPGRAELDPRALPESLHEIRDGADVARALRVHGKPAVHAHEPAVRRPEGAHRLREARDGQAAPADARRADESSRHGVHRLAGQDDQQLQGRPRPRLARHAPHLAGRAGDLDLRQQVGDEVRGRHPQVQNGQEEGAEEARAAPAWITVAGRRGA
mmetsp:Transcript_33803/g.102108  ORF Transcript_33803/g.102108 Transcript_33803/m.102108 type:complete len:357 (+) Transcript_33803:1504-2574(+)